MKKNPPLTAKEHVPKKLPKGALGKINFGQAFAEYDQVLDRPDIFVKTTAMEAADDASRGKSFFIGRRGTGKTALTKYIEKKSPSDVHLLDPQVFDYDALSLTGDEWRDTRQKPFKTALTCFKRAICDEVLSRLAQKERLDLASLPPNLSRERNLIEDHTFDNRFSSLLNEAIGYLDPSKNRQWSKFQSHGKVICTSAVELCSSKYPSQILLIDRLDEAWDGSDRAVVLLMALMHACVELNAIGPPVVRPLLFLRENIFERVRLADNEFARIETGVVSMDWSRPQLIELIERRISGPQTVKFGLGGPTWDAFIESTEAVDSRGIVFQACQERPRDILTYFTFALDAAKDSGHERILAEDFQKAGRGFSESRLKDLADEYSENYPHIGIVLSKFYGMGRELTFGAIEHIIKKLLVDSDITRNCAKWIYRHQSAELFTELLYNIGFFGVSSADKGARLPPVFRSLGVKSPTPPRTTRDSTFVIHGAFVEALRLKDTLVTRVDETIELRREGLVEDIPGSIDLGDYYRRLDELQEEVKTLPTGSSSFQKYEDIVGEIIRLCFHASLVRVEPQVRDIDGLKVRDWMCSNIAERGFWSLIRDRYAATEVIWECKNKGELQSADFNQALRYMSNKTAGRFVIVCFRGEVTPHYSRQVKEIVAPVDGLVLLLTDKDLLTFLRQARSGKTSREGHLQELYSTMVRAIS